LRQQVRASSSWPSAFSAWSQIQQSFSDIRLFIQSLPVVLDRVLELAGFLQQQAGIVK